MSTRPGTADRLLRAAAQVPAVLLVPGLLFALLTRGEPLLAAASALVALGGLFAAISLRAWLRRHAHPRSVLLSTSVLHAGLLVLLLTASEWAAREQAHYWGTATVVVGLALAAGLSAPMLPQDVSSAALNRLAGTLAAALLLVHLIGAPSSGLLITSAVLSAAAVPAAVMRMSDPSEQDPGEGPASGPEGAQ
ncbi:hypothetical protein [Nesterenkonia populi]